MTHTRWLREIAKFVAGLVAGDLIAGLWLLGSGSLPQTFAGITITTQFTELWIGFDIFVILLLIHYAWNPDIMEPHATSRTLFLVSGTIMGGVAIAHFLRLIFGWPLIFDGWSAPMWVSWVGVIVAAYISYTSFHFFARNPRRTYRR